MHESHILGLGIIFISVINDDTNRYVTTNCMAYILFEKDRGWVQSWQNEKWQISDSSCTKTQQHSSSDITEVLIMLCNR